jgi:hypothetical protein
VSVAFHDLVGLVDHHAIAAEGSERDESHNIWNRVRVIEALTVAGAPENGRRSAIDALRFACLVGQKKHSALAGGLTKTVAAWVCAVELEAVDRIAEIVCGSTPEAVAASVLMAMQRKMSCGAPDLRGMMVSTPRSGAA